MTLAHLLDVLESATRPGSPVACYLTTLGVTQDVIREARREWEILAAANVVLRERLADLDRGERGKDE